MFWETTSPLCVGCTCWNVAEWFKMGVSNRVVDSPQAVCGLPTLRLEVPKNTRENETLDCVLVSPQELTVPFHNTQNGMFL